MQPYAKGKRSPGSGPFSSSLRRRLPGTCFAQVARYAFVREETFEEITLRPALRFTLLSVALMALIACDEKLSTLAGPTPTLDPTFASIQRDIFEAGDSSGPPCIRCHTSTGRNPAGGLNLNHEVAFDQLVNVPSARKPGAIRVIPDDPQNSYVIQKLEGAPGIVGNRMPTNGPYLTDGQILILKRWIALGARRN